MTAFLKNQRRHVAFGAEFHLAHLRNFRRVFAGKYLIGNLIPGPDKSGIDHVALDNRGSNTAFNSSTTKETSPPRRKTALIMRVSATVQA